MAESLHASVAPEAEEGAADEAPASEVKARRDSMLKNLRAEGIRSLHQMQEYREKGE